MFRKKNDYNLELAVMPTEGDEQVNDVEIMTATPKEFKAIPDASIARKLIKLGNVVADIKPLHKPEDTDKKPTNFIFKVTEKLISDYSEITGEDLRL